MDNLRQLLEFGEYVNRGLKFEINIEIRKDYLSLIIYLVDGCKAELYYDIEKDYYRVSLIDDAQRILLPQNKTTFKQTKVLCMKYIRYGAEYCTKLDEKVYLAKLLRRTADKSKVRSALQLVDERLKVIGNYFDI